MLKIKRLTGFLGLILLSQSDLISLHKHAKQRFHMNVAVSMATFMDFFFAIVSQLFADFDFNCNSFIPETRKYPPIPVVCLFLSSSKLGTYQSC